MASGSLGGEFQTQRGGTQMQRTGGRARPVLRIDKSLTCWEHAASGDPRRIERRRFPVRPVTDCDRRVDERGRLRRRSQVGSEGRGSMYAVGTKRDQVDMLRAGLSVPDVR